MPRPTRASRRRCTRRRAATPSAAAIVAGSSGFTPRRFAQESAYAAPRWVGVPLHRHAVDLVQLGDQLDLDRGDGGHLDRELDRG